MSNPFTTNRKIFAAYASMWFLIFLSHVAIIMIVQDIKFYAALVDSFFFNFLYLIIGIGIWYTVRFNNLESYTPLKIFLDHIVSAVITAVIWVAASEFIVSKILSQENFYLEFLNQSLIWRFLIGILYYIALVSINYVIIYYNNFQEKVLKEVELKGLVKEAELNALKYQINPHFIFNSLNSISSLTISNPQRAQEMTIKLSSFLRSTLVKNDNQKSRLIDELNNAMLYMDIEKIRFADKFEFVEEIKPECKEVEVPNMILQPLFENAVKHGVYESLEKVIIKLSCSIEKEYFKIIVENNFDPESVPKRGAGIGIKNIQNRMKLIYNQDNLVVVDKTNSTFKITIYIPMS
ncbi:MAG: LytT family sensor histidine kinase [Ignavibacteria bacterium]|nr:MAG: LytT family sensor histidine kinase [Ignavibacteria bacterium]KAF0159865.1 MAG: LytT family sensor histidine kinase [Ignavibacteria bacterium]